VAEIDTVRSIIKGLSQRDAENGDITFIDQNKGDIVSALMTGKYSVDKEKPITSPHCKKKTERIWFDIDPEVADALIDDYCHGEVLNRPAEPCWWR
jgi:hypothetical protein